MQMICVVFVGEENSRVQAHIDGDEFSAHILTDETEYNVEVRSAIKSVSVKIREGTLMFSKIMNLILPPNISCIFHMLKFIFLILINILVCFLFVF